MKRKTIFFFILLSTLLVPAKLKNTTGLAVKGEKVKENTDTRKTVEINSNENIRSGREKYFSLIEFKGKIYKVIFIEDFKLYKEMRKQLSKYSDLAILYYPRSRQIICFEKNNYSDIFFSGEIKVSTTERNNKICTKAAAEKVYSFPDLIDTEEIEKIEISFEGKVFLNERTAKEIFRF